MKPTIIIACLVHCFSGLETSEPTFNTQSVLNVIAHEKAVMSIGTTWNSVHTGQLAITSDPTHPVLQIPQQAFKSFVKNYVVSQEEEDFIGDIATMLSIRRKPCWFEDSLTQTSKMDQKIDCWCDSKQKETALELDIMTAPRITFSFQHTTEHSNVAKIVISGSEYLLQKKFQELPMKEHEVCSLSIEGVKDLVAIQFKTLSESNPAFADLEIIDNQVQFNYIAPIKQKASGSLSSEQEQILKLKQSLGPLKAATFDFETAKVKLRKNLIMTCSICVLMLVILTLLIFQRKKRLEKEALEQKEKQQKESEEKQKEEAGDNQEQQADESKSASRDEISRQALAKIIEEKKFREELKEEQAGGSPGAVSKVWGFLGGGSSAKIKSESKEEENNKSDEREHEYEESHSCSSHSQSPHSSSNEENQGHQEQVQDKN